MSYRVVGEGKPVVLLHGSMINDPWEGFEEKLAKFYRVYLPDLPGFGASDAVEGERHNTDLFAQALCQLLEREKLQDAPIIALSLGTVVAVKAAERGCTQGKLALVGMPGKVARGWKTELARIIPIPIAHWLVTTRWGKEKLLIPAVSENIGERNRGLQEEFLRQLEITDPRAIVEVDYKKEIEQDLRASWARVKNERVVIYGELDAQKDTTLDLAREYITIPEAGHSVFRYQPGKALEVIREIIPSQ